MSQVPYGSGTARNSVPYGSSIRASNSSYFFDQPWYRIINPGPNGSRSLLGDYPEAFGHLIVCVAPLTLPGSNTPFLTKDGKQARMFAVFRDVLSFWEYLRQWPADRQNFFEVVPGSRPQKPHFDIDLTITKAEKYAGQSMDVIATTVLSQVVEGSLAIFQQWGLTVNLEQQLLVYSSHGSEKRSFHVVWNGYCHANNAEAEAFYHAVLAWITAHHGDRYVGLIDKAVYSVLQNFRLLGSSKAGSDRTKVLHGELAIGGQTIIHHYTDPSAYHSPEQRALADLTESLLADTSDCQMLPRLIAAPSHHQVRSHHSEDLTDAEVDECMSMMRAKIEETPFTLKEVKGNLIILAREAPTWCPLCPDLDEPHQAQHPYMFVTDHTLYWNCRRTPHDKSLRIGCLLSRSRSTTDEVPAEDGDDKDHSQRRWEIQWGVGSETPGLSIEVVDSPVPVLALASPMPSEVNAASSSTDTVSIRLSAQEQIRRVTLLYQQQKQQEQDRQQYRSLSSFTGITSMVTGSVLMPPPPSPSVVTYPISSPASPLTESGGTPKKVAGMGRRFPRPVGAP